MLGVPAEGTIAAEARRITPAVSTASAEADKALDLLLDSAKALRRGDDKQAAKLAIAAKRHVDKGLLGLEALEPSDHEELQTYLQKTIAGYRLFSKGITSYARGIEELDFKLLEESALKSQAGFQEVYDASEDLFRFLRSQS